MNRNETPLPNVKVQEKKILGPQEIPIVKLLSMAKKDDLLDFLELTSFREIERQIKANNAGKFKVSEMKRWIFEHPEYLERFRRSPVVVRLYDDYVQKMQKANSVEGVEKQTKELQASKIMKAARKKYVGCIATKTPPEVYEDCLDEYNDPTESYEKYSIVPYNALRQKQYDHELELGNSQRAGVLKLTERTKISYLPKGLRQYIDAHPEKFNDYLREIKAEGEYLDAVKHAMRNEKDLNARERMRGRLYDYITEEKEY